LWTPPAVEILRIEAGRPRSAPRWDRRHAAEAASSRGGELHQGLLHRPGAGRPAPLQGQAEIAICDGLDLEPGSSRGARCGQREGGRRVGSACVSPPRHIGLAIVPRAEPARSSPSVKMAYGSRVDCRSFRFRSDGSAGEAVAKAAALGLRAALAGSAGPPLRRRGTPNRSQAPAPDARQRPQSAENGHRAAGADRGSAEPKQQIRRTST